MAFQCGEPPDVLAERWTERDLRELGVLFAHEPPIESRMDLWGAQIVAAGVNPWRRKGSPAVNPKDLIPEWWNLAPQQTQEQMIQILKAMAAAGGGKV